MSVYFGMNYTVEPDILINDNDTLQVGNLELQFIHTPGHTVGGMCIYVKSENVLFSGDTLFQQSVGRTDFPGGSFEQIVNSIRNRLFVLPEETKVFPGHMGPTNIGFEKRSNPFV
jgi:glyoxylase-like metal-dependent hydrolase (beta-lactamase superfamily II)